MGVTRFPRKLLDAELAIDEGVMHELSDIAQREGKDVETLVDEAIKLRIIYFRTLNEGKECCIYDRKSDTLYNIEFTDK